MSRVDIPTAGQVVKGARFNNGYEVSRYDLKWGRQVGPTSTKEIVIATPISNEVLNDAGTSGTVS
jgi:hypothetical protein